jgi:hypothetical protein
MMKEDDWLELDFDEFEEHYQKKKMAKQKKRSWREIEAYKEKQRERKAVDEYEHYFSV